MHKRAKRLALTRESIRPLTTHQLDLIAGGDSGSLSCTGPDCTRSMTVGCRPSFLPLRTCLGE